MTTFLVGGAVRDLLLGGAVCECDYTFTGTIEAFLQQHPAARMVGRSVKVCLLDGKDHMPLRGPTITDDLASRDLTINALALEANGILHMHPLALHDLQQGILRPASPTAFLDDPARIFRAARFAAHFADFRVDDAVYTQMRDPHVQAAQTELPAERVGREVLKALGCPKPSRFLQVLAQGGLLTPWFAELHGADTLPAGPPQWHRGTILEHIGEVMDAVAGDPLSVWMALCHDLGKVSTPPDILPHHYGHEKRGVDAAISLADRLALPKRYSEAGAVAAREHMKGGTYAQLRVGTRRDLLMAVHNAGLDIPFWHLVNADSHSHISSLAHAELKILLAIRLAPEWHNKGQISANKLRALHCAALPPRATPSPR